VEPHPSSSGRSALPGFSQGLLRSNLVQCARPRTWSASCATLPHRPKSRHWLREVGLASRNKLIYHAGAALSDRMDYRLNSGCWGMSAEIANAGSLLALHRRFFFRLADRHSSRQGESIPTAALGAAAHAHSRFFAGEFARELPPLAPSTATLAMLTSPRGYSRVDSIPGLTSHASSITGRSKVLIQGPHCS